MSQSVPNFIQALCGEGPERVRNTVMDLYAWLVGRWELD
jgi:hypothetical protein